MRFVYEEHLNEGQIPVGLYTSFEKRGKRERMIVKKRCSVVFILFLLIMMNSLAALACSHSYVIQYLFGENMESDAAQMMEVQVQPVDYVQRSETTVCTVKDGYFDGRTLAVGMGFQTDRHIYLVGDEVKVNGNWVDYLEYGSSIEEMWVGNTPPNKEINPSEKIHGIQYIFSQSLQKGEPAEVTMCMTMLVPKTGVELIDIYQADKSKMWTEIDAAYENGLTPIDANEPYEVLIGTGWWNGKLDTTRELNKPYCNVDALVEYANMEVVDTVAVTFTLKAL